MQYLSQRLATKPAQRRDGEPPRGALAAQQRQRLLDASERLIAKRGANGTSIEALVKEAGVSSITFYEHFKTKEDCFVAAFDRAVGETVEELRRDASADLSWLEQFCTGLRALLATIVADPARARMCLVEARTGGDALGARFEALLDRVAEKLREGRRLGSAPAGLPATLEEATAGGLAWLLCERLEADGADAIEALYPQMVDVAIAPYLGEGEAARVAVVAVDV
jgi:AcrR family transcriptional regulator